MCDLTRRSLIAGEIARQFGAKALVIFVKDGQTGQHRPAPGFPQRLPGGALWRALLRQAQESSDPICSDVPFPDEGSQIIAAAFRQDPCIFVFLGTNSLVVSADLAAVFSLVGVLFRTEVELEAMRAREAAALDASKHAKHLAMALDAARAHVAATAIELRELNTELERRVIEEVERRNIAEASLRQAQKLEAIGQLTGGVAHDFNNLLTVIIGGLDTIRRQLDTMDAGPQIGRIARAQMMAQQSAQRAATLTARLLAFSRRQPLDPKPTNVDQVISGMIELLKSTLGEPIRIEAVATAGLWRAMVDLPELEHAILNVAVNARDAMPEGGKLTIETGNIFLDEAYVSQLAEPVAPGQYVIFDARGILETVGA